MRFHMVMAKAGAVVGYQEGGAYVHVPECRLSTLLMVCRSIVEEFGVSEDEVTVSTHHADRKSWIRLTVPFGTEMEVVEEGGCEGSEDRDEDEEGAPRSDGVTWLTEKVGYVIESGELALIYENNGSRQRLFRLDMQKVYDLYDELPERADRGTILDALEKLGIRMRTTHVNYLMHFLASYPVFSAELVREGNRNYLVKRDSRITEMSDKLAVEREVIGTPWEVR